MREDKQKQTIIKIKKRNQYFSHYLKKNKTSKACYYDSGEFPIIPPSSPVEKQTDVVSGAFVQSAEPNLFLISVAAGSEKELKLPDRSLLYRFNSL